MTASTATETAAIHGHLFRDAGGGWVRSRFPTIRTLADGRRTRQPADHERGASSGWIRLLGSMRRAFRKWRPRLTDKSFGDMKIAL
jgi:hypothetical protein